MFCTTTNRPLCCYCSEVYPRKLVSLPRILKKNDNPTTNNINDDDVIMVSTYGADKPLQDIVENLPNKDKVSIKKVYKTASSLKQKLCTPRKTCMGPAKGISEKCNRSNCMCCSLMSQNETVSSISGKDYKTANGNCTTKIALYHLRCKLCGQPYVGKTVQMIYVRKHQLLAHAMQSTKIIKKSIEIKPSNIYHT